MYYKRLKKLSKKQCVQFAIFCAEQALPVFEKECPNNLQPREAIDAAKKWLENPCNASFNVSIDAARAAAIDAGYGNTATRATRAAAAAARAAGAVNHATAAYDAYAAAIYTIRAVISTVMGVDAETIDDINNYLLELEACHTAIN